MKTNIADRIALIEDNEGKINGAVLTSVIGELLELILDLQERVNRVGEDASMRKLGDM